MVCKIFGILQTMGLGKSWGLYKRDNLIRRFRAMLTELGVSKRPAHTVPPRTDSMNAPVTTALDEEGSLRQLVGRIVNTLPIAETRALRVPLGDVYDAMKGK